ncbi:MAG: ubiquinol-cytochrome c reductase iron-sulfur subunit [Actinomycetota bacterium]
MRTERAVEVSLLVSTGASIALVVVYVLGGQAQAEGILLGLSLGGLGVGVTLGTVKLLPSRTEIEEREEIASSDREEQRAEEVIEAPVEEIGRRKAITRLLIGAGGTLLGALAIPALSLGPRPGDSLFRTAWRSGARVVDRNGDPVRPTDLVLESVVTVFPQDAVGDPDSQTLIVKVTPDLLTLPEGREGWAPEGCIGYSKICTHAGCPVGLYRAQSHELLCPCHQSTFDVLEGAVPTFGPADRPLPQLPLAVDDEGFLIAQGDFPEPVGPGFWNVFSEGDS